MPVEAEPLVPVPVEEVAELWAEAGEAELWEVGEAVPSEPGPGPGEVAARDAAGELVPVGVVAVPRARHRHCRTLVVYREDS